jgi:hypothetical protein
MNEKLARKDCPFRSYPTATCKGESCSWYMREYEKCTVVVIAELESTDKDRVKVANQIREEYAEYGIGGTD